MAFMRLSFQSVLLRLPPPEFLDPQGSPGTPHNPPSFRLIFTPLLVLPHSTCSACRVFGFTLGELRKHY
jgi:hypothetical protein